MVTWATMCLGDHRVDLKRVPPKSRPAAPPLGDAARKDSAVHVSLSSDSPVKQPGISTIPPPEPEEPSKLRGTDGNRTPLPPWFSEELLRRAIAPRRRRAVDGFICRRNCKSQHLFVVPWRVFFKPTRPCKNGHSSKRFAPYRSHNPPPLFTIGEGCSPTEHHQREAGV